MSPISLQFTQIIDYVLKYLTSNALLKEKMYCMLSCIVYAKLKNDNTGNLEKYLPVRNLA